MKTADLIDKGLDWAVAKCDGVKLYPSVQAHGRLEIHFSEHLGCLPYSPSTNWAQGGPIIERECILLRPLRRAGHALDGQCLAMYDGANTGSMVSWVKRTDFPRHYLAGPTPLIAAMRCFVASKLGDEVEIPKELL